MGEGLGLGFNGKIVGMILSWRRGFDFEVGTVPFLGNLLDVGLIDE